MKKLETAISTRKTFYEQTVETREWLRKLISESLKALDPHDAVKILSYEDCLIKFVHNDHTSPDFEGAFVLARESAFEDYFKNLGEEIESEYDDCEPFTILNLERTTRTATNGGGEVEGYIRLGEDDPQGTTFFEGMYGDLYNRINKAMRYGLNPDAFAAWAGVNAWAFAESGEYGDLRIVYYKKK